MAETMEIEPEWSVREPGELTWWAGDLRQRIIARVTPDPNPDEGEFVQILIETDVVRQDPISDGLATHAVSLNQVGSYSGLAPSATDPSVLALVANVPVWPDNVRKRKDLVLFVAAVQVAEAYGLAAELEEALGVPRASTAHPASGTRPRAEPKIDELWERSWDPPSPSELGAPSQFAGPLMVECVERLQGPPCVLCTGSEEGVAAEFPFGVTASIIELRTGETHARRLVTGLLILERYPFDASDGLSPDKCLELAAMEREARLPGASLGGWTISSEGYLAHAAFLPNSAVGLSHPFDWLVSAAGRARWVTEAVFGLSWENDYDQCLKNKREMLETLRNRT